MEVPLGSLRPGGRQESCGKVRSRHGGGTVTGVAWCFKLNEDLPPSNIYIYIFIYNIHLLCMYKYIYMCVCACVPDYFGGGYDIYIYIYLCYLFTPDWEDY